MSSLLYQLASEVLEAGGVEGCGAAQAHALKQLAEDSLPAVPAHMDDGFDVLNQYIQHSRPLTLSELHKRLPGRISERSDTDFSWAVGVTTCPRRHSTLNYCIDSLLQSGWTDPHVFYDGDKPSSVGGSGTDSTIRRKQTGAFPAFYLALTELYMRHPDADAFLMMQDDAVFPPKSPVRQFLNQALWPDNRPGIVSLYTASDSNGPTSGWHQKAVKRNLNGAVALVFSGEVAKRFLTSRFALEYRERCVDRKLAAFPDLLRDWCDKNNIPIHLPTPSLVQHIGQTSTIWKNGRALADRYADQFIGDPR